MIPTEPIGSIPHPLPLIQAMQHHGHEHPDLEPHSTSRDTAFAKITARVRGTALAARLLGA